MKEMDGRNTVRIPSTVSLDLEKSKHESGGDLSMTNHDLEQKLYDLTLDLQRPASRAYSVGQRSAMTDYSESVVPPGFYAGSSQPSSPTLQTHDLPTTSHQPIVTKPLPKASSGRFSRSARRYLPTREAISEEDMPPESEQDNEYDSERNIPYGALIDYQIALIMDHPTMEKERAVSLDYEVAKLINRLWNIGVGSLSIYTTQGLQDRISHHVDNWSVFRTSTNSNMISLKKTISNALDHYVTTLETALEIVNSSDIKFKPLLVLALADVDPIGSSTELDNFFTPLSQKLERIRTKLPKLDTIAPQIRIKFVPLKDTIRGNDALSKLSEALKGDALERVVSVSPIPEGVEYSEFLEECIMQQASNYGTSLKRKLIITSASRLMLESSALRSLGSSERRGSIPQADQDSYQPPPQVDRASSLRSGRNPRVGTQRNNQVASSRRPTRDFLPKTNATRTNPYVDEEINDDPRPYATKRAPSNRMRAPRGAPDPIPGGSSRSQPSSGGIVSDSLNTLGFTGTRSTREHTDGLHLALYTKDYRYTVALRRQAKT